MLAEAIDDISKNIGFSYKPDVELPIAGGLSADFYIEKNTPLIIIAANSTTRLLEAEIIHMQYKVSNMSGFVLAVAESQSAVGKRQFERANYYTGKTVTYNKHDLSNFISSQLQ